MSASVVSALPPTTALFEGVLQSSGGGAAADGNYDLTFSIYAAKSGGGAVWSEGPVKVAVKGGQFSYALGTSKALSMGSVAMLPEQWLGIQVGADPELQRVRLHTSLFALVAQNAMGVQCSGCVSVSAMKFDGDVDLAGNSIKAKNAIFSGNVAASAFAGDGSQLTGIKMPVGECKNAGEVVKGIKADGSLLCVKGGAGALPIDGLDEISNKVMTNQFLETGAAPKKKVPIPDNQGIDAVSNITFGDIGVAQSFDVTVSIENTDLSTVAVYLLPPDDKKTGWVLCDPCGKKDEKKYSAQFNAKNPPKSQAGNGLKIDQWIGKNPKGLWTLKVKDVAFCIPQQAGNATYCDTQAKNDGWIADWSVTMQYVSNKKVGVNGSINVAGDVGLGDSGISCTTKNEGAIRYNKTSKELEYCNGSAWGDVRPKSDNRATYRWAVFDTYGNNIGNWMHSNSSELFGGVTPSTWTDGNGKASSLSSKTQSLLALFNKKGYAGHNANVWSQIYKQYSSTTGKVAMALFRVRNSTAKTITWKPHWRYTSYSGWSETASVALNGSNIWSGNCGGSLNCTTSHSLSIPANRTSTVVFVSTSGSEWNSIRGITLGFYNNSLKLPTGLEFVDDLEKKSDGWND